ncbi:lysylphosphatidylglycerol synthase domain-containing protein [Humibacter sp.]|uniref:lysylphosphatidylglycerol synthase domain-containing protein n=1 Tax=Humibacter sp. TaxID=1940291 RepID=UPI003F81EDEE
MTDDTRPPSLDSSAPSSSSRRAAVVNVLRWVLLALVIAAAVWQLAVNWTTVIHTVGSLQWHRTLLSFLFVLAGVACGTMSWQVLVDGLGVPIGIGRGAQIFLVGQLGKYLPGSVWAYVLQIELGRKAGLARARVFAATLFSVVVAVVAALLAGSLAVPQLTADDSGLSWLPWLYLVLPFALILLYPPALTALVRFGFKILRRPRPDHPVTFWVVVQSVLWALGSYISYGAHLWLLGDTHHGLTLGPLGLCIGTMALGMLAGIVGFLLPAGVGARELVIIAALSPLVGIGQATAYAAVSRLMFIASDLLSAGGAAGIAVIARRRKGAYHGDVDLIP